MCIHPDPPHTHVEVVERAGELSRPGVLAQAGVLGADALSRVGDPRDGLLQLLVDELPVGLVGGHVRVLQAGAGRRVQQGNVSLQHAARRRHLLLVLHVLQLLHDVQNSLNVTRHTPNPGDLNNTNGLRTLETLHPG